MAEVNNNEEETALPAKRKPDLTPIDEEDDPKKSKLEALPKDPSFIESKLNKDKSNEDADHSNEQDDYDEEEEDYEFEDEDDDDDDDDNDDDGERSNGKAVADRKGKGIMVEEEEDDNDDDDDVDSDDDDSSESGGDSDLSDDPLAEVDLDNILPSRTRRRVVNSRLNIAKGVGDNGGDA